MRGEREVARIPVDLLLERPAERVRSGCCQTEPVALGGSDREPAPLGNRLHDLVDVGRGRRVQLDDGREELGLQLRRGRGLPGFAQEHVDARREREGLGVEDHQLLLDADCPGSAGAEVLLDHLPRTPWTGRPAASHA